MGGLAALAREAGHRVTGCDSGVYPPMSDQLRALGIDLIEGYSVDQLQLKPDVYVVGNVVSRARMPDGTPRYPLMEAILESGANYTSGPQWLSEHVLQGRHVMAVAGTHGKTTTTSMLAWILEYAGLQPGFLVGGVPLNFGVSARLSGAQPSDFFVIEADEYDTAFFDKRSKFVHYHAKTAILNNLEYDHADIFADITAIETQFHHLVRTVPGVGRLIVNAQEASLQRVLQRGCWSEKEFFGDDSVSDVQQAAREHGWSLVLKDGEDFDVIFNGERQGTVSWQLNGAHNRMNALAAIAAARHVGVAPAVAIEALAQFVNVKRRMEVRGVAAGVTVLDDFAHHPTAIATTVQGLRRKVGSGRILAVLEPRSNTMKLGSMKEALPVSLAQADLVFVYGAKGGKDVVGWNLHDTFAPLGDKAATFDDMQMLVDAIVDSARSGDHILVMSNGGFGGVHEKLLTTLNLTAEART